MDVLWRPQDDPEPMAHSAAQLAALGARLVEYSYLATPMAANLTAAWTPAPEAHARVSFAQGLLSGATGGLYERAQGKYQGAPSGAAKAMSDYADLLRGVRSVIDEQEKQWAAALHLPPAERSDALRDILDRNTRVYHQRFVPTVAEINDAFGAARDGLLTPPTTAHPTLGPPPTADRSAFKVLPDALRATGHDYEFLGDTIATAADKAGLKELHRPVEAPLGESFRLLVAALETRVRNAAEDFRTLGAGLADAAEVYRSGDDAMTEAFAAA